MGEEACTGEAVSHLQTWFLNLLSRPLPAKDREAVLGDLCECEPMGWQAAHELLLLLLHRQLSHWREWKPWVALSCVVPTAIVLSQISGNVSAFVVMQLWTRFHSGEWFHTALSGPRSLVAVVCICSAVAMNGWCSGLVVAVLSRATTFVAALAFYVIWLFCGASLPLTTSAGWYSLAVNLCLFVVPSVLGMVYGFHSNNVERRQAFCFVFLVIVGTIASIWTDSWFGKALEIWSSGMLPLEPLRARAWPFLISALPAFYLLVRGLIHKREHPTQWGIVP